MQVYRDLDQITNKHPLDEREGIPHHLLGHVDWDEEYSVQRFEKEALKKIEEIENRGRLPILVGGTHYYNQAVMFKNATLSTTVPAVEKSQESELTTEQLALLNGPTSKVLEKLKEVDPTVAGKFHPNDSRRLRRALEIFFTTNQKPSDIYEEQQAGEEKGTESLALRFRTLVFWIWCEQATLNPRLDGRVDVMLKQGLYDEIQELYDDYEKTRHATPQNEDDEVARKGVYQVIGFKEFLPILPLSKNHEAKDPKVLAECIEKMKQRTRKYSKQQTKFMKNTLMPKINTMVSWNPTRDDIAVAVLDATDLTQWKSVVAENGIEIARKFLEGNVNQDHFIADTPQLKELMVTPKKFTNTQWKHYTCDVCVDNATGEPIVAVGENLWQVHLKSRKHRSTVAGKAKFEHNQRQVALKRQREEAGLDEEHAGQTADESRKNPGEREV